MVLTGCTAIGYSVGALADNSSSKRTVEELANVRTGTSITMWLHDDRRIHGQFLGCRDSLSSTPLPMPPASELGSRVPLRAVVVLGTEFGPQQVPSDLVRQISVPVNRGKWRGAAVGLLIDATIVVGLATSGGAPR